MSRRTWLGLGGLRAWGSVARRAAAAGLVAATVPLLAMAGPAWGLAPGHAAGHRTGRHARAGSHLDWLLTRRAVRDLEANPRVSTLLGQSTVYEIVRPGQSPVGRGVRPVWTFSSVSTMGKVLSAWKSALPVHYVLYDPEAWKWTPRWEQEHPAAAMAAAGALARSRGLRLVAAPALDLMRVSDAHGRGHYWQRYLRLRVAAGAARAAGVVDIQAQSLERSVATYSHFVRRAAAQARRAHPGVTVLAGLSTNPPGAAVTSSEIAAAMDATRGFVSGYWLNIPGPGARCPTCGPRDPSVAMGALLASA